MIVYVSLELIDKEKKSQLKLCSLITICIFLFNLLTEVVNNGVDYKKCIEVFKKTISVILNVYRHVGVQ